MTRTAVPQTAEELRLALLESGLHVHLVRWGSQNFWRLVFSPWRGTCESERCLRTNGQQVDKSA